MSYDGIFAFKKFETFVGFPSLQQVEIVPVGLSRKKMGPNIPEAIVNSVKRIRRSSWVITRLTDERTGDSCLGIDFPRRLHGRDFQVVDDDLAEQPGRLRAQLKTRGAAFTGNTKEAQIKFVRKLLKRPQAERILAMKPGFRKDGFILGKRMLGSARSKYRWQSQEQNLKAQDIGHRRGNPDAWARDVGEVALHSSSLTTGLLIALASCVPSYFEWRMKRAPDLKPLLSETASFNFEGESGSGKTNISRAAAGLIGPPRLIAKWDFTRRSLEELAESRNDLPFILDDTETHVEEGMSLKTALRHVTQVVPKGTSKHISKTAAKRDLHPLSWSNFGLTTSPPDLEKVAQSLGWKRTDGERVRFISIPVPPVSKGGIFDWLTGTDVQRVEEGKALTERLERGIAQNYGLIFPRWIDYLLEADRSKRLVELVERFVSHVASDGTGWDSRYARKFGVAYAVGWLAVDAGIVPWPKNWPRKAVVRCYRRSIAAIHNDQILANKMIQWIANVSTDPSRFVPIKSSHKSKTSLNKRMLGFRTKHLGKSVLAVRDETLRKMAGSHAVEKAAVQKLQQQNILVGGHGQRRTNSTSHTDLGWEKDDQKTTVLADQSRASTEVRENSLPEEIARPFSDDFIRRFVCGSVFASVAVHAARISEHSTASSTAQPRSRRRAADVVYGLSLLMTP